MPRRIVSGLLLSVWLILFAVGFSEDLGLFDYGDPGLDQSLDVTLASLGDAIQIDDHHHPLKTVFPAFSFLRITDPYLHHSLPVQLLREGPGFIKASLKVFRLYHVFLI